MRIGSAALLLFVSMSAVLIGQELPETEDEQASQDLAEYLLFVKEHPVNLNHADLNRLMDLPYITPYRALVLERYLRNNPGLDDPFLLVRDSVLEASELESLLPYICLDRQSPAKAGFFKFSTRVQRRWPQDEWSDSPWENRNRVQYRANEHIELFLQNQHDPGEPDWNDYYSGNISWSDGDKSVVLGDYQIDIGRGLAFGGNSPSFFSSYWSGSGNIRASRVKPYYSSHEYRALRGVCLQGTAGGSVGLLGFASRRYVDVRTDSAGRITNIYDDGYHRIGTEIERKNNSTETVIGGRAGLSDGLSYDIGISGYKRSFDRAALLARYSPGLLGLDAGMVGDDIRAFAELTGSGNGLEGFNTEVIFLSRGYSGQLKIYGYSPGYGPPRFNADNYYDGNEEKGATLTGMWSGPAGTDISAAYNQFFPWLPLAVSSQGSRGCRYECRVEQKIPGGVKTNLRVRSLRKEIFDDASQSAEALYHLSTLTLRTGLQWNISKKIVSGANYQTSFFRDSRETSGERGELTSLSVKAGKFRGLMILGQTVFYDVPDYNARLYINEPELRSGGSFHGYWGKGRRDALIVRFNLWRYGAMDLKAARQTRYYNGETTGDTEAGMEVEILLK